MAKLIANVWIDGQWYGPAHGNASDVPVDVAEQVTNPACWDKAPKQAKAAPSVPASPPDSPSPAPSVERGLTAALAALPDDKAALLAFRDAHDLDVDGRLGVENLRTALEEAITE